MCDLGNNGVSGKLYRTIYCLNSCAKISVKMPYGNTDVFELEELVRQGSVLGANSLETVVRDAQNGMAGSRLGNMFLYPLCFVDDIAVVSNSLMDARRNQTAIKVFQRRKKLQLHPEKSHDLVNRGNRKRRGEELKLNSINMKKYWLRYRGWCKQELWLFRPFAGSPPGLFAPLLFRLLACSPSGSFTPWLVHLPVPGWFTLWLVRPLADLPPPLLNIPVIHYCGLCFNLQKGNKQVWHHVTE